jgi:hypothetical protein
MASRANSPQAYVPARARVRSAVSYASNNAPAWLFAFAAFGFLLASIVALNSFKVAGIPVRAFLAVGVLGLSGILFSTTAFRVFRENILVITLAVLLGVLGAGVSLINGTSISDIISPLMEVHVQAVVTILAAGILARICGPKTAVFAIVCVVGASAAVAMLQLLHVDAAWRLRLALGALPAEATEGLKGFERRPVGLSFSPIQLATQLCLAFAALAAVREKLRGQKLADGKFDPMVLIAVVGLCVASFAAQTRAPITGGAVFLVAYLIWRRSIGFALLLVAGGAILYFLGPTLLQMIQGSAPRLARADDNSAVGRITMFYYGLRLFIDNPLGYGLTFDPAEMWHKYWFDLYTMPAPMVVQVHDLHNYVESMFNIYGVGLLLMFPIAWKLLRQAGSSLIFFIPYVIQILLHNSGPFYNDNVIWFVIAAIAAASNTKAAPELLAHVRSRGRMYALVRHAR